MYSHGVSVFKVLKENGECAVKNIYVMASLIIMSTNVLGMIGKRELRSNNLERQTKKAKISENLNAPCSSCDKNAQAKALDKILRGMSEKIEQEADAIARLEERIEDYKQKEMPPELVKILSEYATRQAEQGALSRLEEQILNPKRAQDNQNLDNEKVDQLQSRKKSIDGFIKNLSKKHRSMFKDLGISDKNLKTIVGGFYDFAHDLSIRPGSGRTKGSLNKKTLERRKKEDYSKLKKSKLRQSKRILKQEQEKGNLEILKEKPKRKRGRPKGSQSK